MSMKTNLDAPNHMSNFLEELKVSLHHMQLDI